MSLTQMSRAHRAPQALGTTALIENPPADLEHPSAALASTGHSLETAGGSSPATHTSCVPLSAEFAATGSNPARSAHSRNTAANTPVSSKTPEPGSNKAPKPSKPSDSVLRIGILDPEVLGTYGDGGNALVLCERARRRGYAAEIVKIGLTDPIPESLDIYTLGGGEDTAQALAAEHLRRTRGLIRAAENQRPILAICASLQVLGISYTDAQNRQVDGLGLLDAETKPQGFRSIGEIVTQPLLAGLREPLTGFENHGGATTLGQEAQPLGRVLAGHGNDNQGFEGVTQGSIVATYMHGPVLARNPELADYLLEQAIGESLPSLILETVKKLRQERFSAVGIEPGGIQAC